MRVVHEYLSDCMCMLDMHACQYMCLCTCQRVHISTYGMRTCAHAWMNGQSLFACASASTYANVNVLPCAHVQCKPASHQVRTACKNLHVCWSS